MAEPVSIWDANHPAWDGIRHLAEHEPQAVAPRERVLSFEELLAPLRAIEARAMEPPVAWWTGPRALDDQARAAGLSIPPRDEPEA